MIRVRRFVLPVLLIGALHATLGSLELPHNLQAVIGRILAVANLTLTLYLIAQLSLALLGRLTARNEASQRVGSQVMTMARVTLAIVFGALLLDNLGIHLTALVTTLGIGSLAVALALQDTLGNFFAGLYLQADRPVRIGDYVRVDTGDEGTVMHIGWRSTRLRTITNNTVVLPNERLSKAVVTNYSLPDPEVAVDVRVTVAYDSDLDRVERLLAEAARHARADHPGMLDDPPPAVRLIPGFGPKGLDLTLSVWVRDFRDKPGVEDAIRRHILARFRVVVFLMTTGDPVDDAGQAAFEAWIGAGGNYVGVHSAADTEYNWPFYGALMGAYFRHARNGATRQARAPASARSRDRRVQKNRHHAGAGSPQHSRFRSATPQKAVGRRQLAEVKILIAFLLPLPSASCFVFSPCSNLMAKNSLSRRLMR